MSKKVAVIGAGFVGSTSAFAMLAQRTANRIALIDVNKEKAEGEAMDLTHGVPFSPGARIEFGDDYALCRDAGVVVITAGQHQKPGQTRLDLAAANVSLFKQIVPQIVQHNRDCILLVVSNPLDILTYHALKISGFPASRVFGTGTLLDSARLRYYLSQLYEVDASNVHAYVLGEHGDSEFAAWNSANIAGIPLSQLPDYNPAKLDEIFAKTKNAAYEVIARKGATYYAIALGVSQTVSAILSDREEVLSLSSLLTNYRGVSDVCLSVPCVLGPDGQGIKRQLAVPFSANEQAAFEKSAATVKEVIQATR